MSAEETIHVWKNEQGGRALDPNDEPESEPGKAPANPAGEQELTDEVLALIEGGDGSTIYCTKGCPPVRPA
jgi:mersacidin/lichenicidin family type 2 lantibiotic